MITYHFVGIQLSLNHGSEMNVTNSLRVSRAFVTNSLCVSRAYSSQQNIHNLYFVRLCIVMMFMIDVQEGKVATVKF